MNALRALLGTSAGFKTKGRSELDNRQADYISHIPRPSVYRASPPYGPKHKVWQHYDGKKKKNRSAQTRGRLDSHVAPFFFLFSILFPFSISYFVLQKT